MGVPHTSLKVPPSVTVKLYMYLLECKERCRLQPKHIRKCVYGVFKGVNYSKMQIKESGSVVGVN